MSSVTDMFAVIYEDDGPNGICGQSCSVTNPWKKLYLFKSEEGLRNFCREVENNNTRKNSRVTYMFYPSNLSYNDINYIDK